MYQLATTTKGKTVTRTVTLAELDFELPSKNIAELKETGKTEFYYRAADEKIEVTRA